MKRSELRTGMVIETRSRSKAMVLIGTKNGDIASGETWFPLDSLDEDLHRRDGLASADIVKVYQPNGNINYAQDRWKEAECIWERNEKTHMIKGKKYSEDTIIEALKNHIPA